MMCVFAAIVAAMMLLCVAAAAGVFPDPVSRRLAHRLGRWKAAVLLRELRECLHGVG